MYFRHTVHHTQEANISHDTTNTRYHQSSRSPATRRVYTSMFHTPQWHGVTQTHFPQGRANPHGTATSRTYFRHTVHHTQEANISHDTTNQPAHQRHAAFIPACFTLPRGTAPRKHTPDQARANPNGTATPRTYFRHTVCPHATSYHITRYRHSSRSPATRRVYTSVFRAPQWHAASHKRTFHPDRANPNGITTSRT